MAELSLLKAPRIATLADTDRLVTVINAAYRVEDFFVFGDRTDRQEVIEYLTTPNTWFFVIDPASGDALAGAVRVEIDGQRGYFAMLAVNPALQGTGVGRRLIVAAEDHCRAAGCECLDLEVVDLREELPAYYRALGFTETGTAPFPVPHKLRRDAFLVLMSKPLAP